MSDDDDNLLDDLFAATAAAAASADRTAAKAHAGSGPAAEAATEDDRRFAELVEGESDLFTHAAQRLREQAEREAKERGEHASLRVEWPEDARTAAQRRAFDLIFEHALQAELVSGAEDRAQHLAEARAKGLDVWPEQHLSGRDPRLQRDRLKERAIVAEAMVRQLGAAGHQAAEQAHQGYLKLSRLHQLACSCWRATTARPGGLPPPASCASCLRWPSGWWAGWRSRTATGPSARGWRSPPCSTGMGLRPTRRCSRASPPRC